MRSRLLSTDGGRRTMVLVFDIGDEVAEGLTAFATEHGLTGSAFTAIGALREVTLGYWNWDTKAYERIEIGEQVEVVSLSGNLALGPNGEPKLHAHLVVAKRDGSAHGGHLLRAIVRPTLEVVLTELPAELHRRTDEATGLALLAP
ncbi:MAG TPA: PPC domain-containing DNA-binding protein [Gemmatimonadaceae bacterium]|nr:PPC domain-containing DNA-binding protein [Gemmatimonadaceae bacterium]